MTTCYTTTLDSPCGALLCIVDETGAVVRIEFSQGRKGDEDRRSRDWPHVLLRLREQGVDRRGRRHAHRGAARPARRVLRRRPPAFRPRARPHRHPLRARGLGGIAADPLGETRSYGEIAQEIGRPGAARAVGRANQAPTRSRSSSPATG